MTYHLTCPVCSRSWLLLVGKEYEDCPFCTVERLRGRVRDLTSDIILVINGKFTKDSWDEKDLARLQKELKDAKD